MNKFLVLSFWCIQTALPARAQPGQDTFWLHVNSLVTNTDNLPADKQLNALHNSYLRIRNYNQRNDSLYLQMLKKMASLNAEKENYLEAIRLTEEAITVFNNHKDTPALSPANLLSNYYYLSNYYEALNQPAERIKALETGIDVAAKLRVNNYTYLYILWMRVKYFFDIGDYVRCAEYARIGERDANKISNDSLHYHGIFLNFEINSQLELNNYAAVEKLLVGKATLYKRTRNELLSNIYEQQGRVALGKENYPVALLNYSAALASVDKLDSIRCLQVLENTGYYLYYKHNKNIPKALNYYFKALKYAKAPATQTTQDAQEALNLLANIANAYADAGIYDSAFHYYQKAFDQVEPGMNEQKFVALPLDVITQYDRVWYITALMIDKGIAWLKLYKATRAPDAIASAMRVFQASDKILARIRLEQSELASRLFWRYDSRRLYEQAIEAAYLTHDIASAFYFFEKNRAVILEDQLMQHHFTNQQGILEQAQLQRNIIQQKKEMQEKGSSPENVSAALFNNIRKLDQLQQKIKANNLVYYQRFIDTTFITLQQVQKQLLGTDKILIELFNSDSAVYVLLATGNSADLKKLNKANYETTVNRYNAYLADATLLNKDHQGYIQAATQLYQLLFGLRNISQQRVIVSPDGSYFPLESLVANDKDQQHYFIYDHAVSYTYSARYLLNETNTPTLASTFMGMAPVQYAGQPDLADLPGSDQSLLRMKEYSKQPHFFIRNNATRKNFLQNFSKYGIIQLYTHAADSSSHQEPVIYFADSVLYLSELVPDKQPDTRLIVLSACETGNGNFYRGEGVFSFNRSFAAIGIPAAVINLWAVDNVPTYKITELFYKYLSKGLPTDIALQKAKLEFLQNPSREATLPYYWAATVLTGKTDAVVTGNAYAWLEYLLFAIAAIGAFIAGKRYWEKNKTTTDQKH